MAFLVYQRGCSHPHLMFNVFSRECKTIYTAMVQQLFMGDFLHDVICVLTALNLRPAALIQDFGKAGAQSLNSQFFAMIGE